MKDKPWGCIIPVFLFIAFITFMIIMERKWDKEMEATYKYEVFCNGDWYYPHHIKKYESGCIEFRPHARAGTITGCEYRIIVNY